MSEVVDIGSRLFGGAVVRHNSQIQEPSMHTCIDMFKLAWRLVETPNVACGNWMSDDQLTKMAYTHLETLLSKNP